MLAPLASRALIVDAAVAGDHAVAVGAHGHILVVGEGLRWTQAPSPVSRLLNAVHFVDASHGWAVGHDAAVLRTTDGGASWDLQHHDAGMDPLFDVLFTDPDNGFVVGAYGMMMRTADGGSTWYDVTYTEFPDSHLFAMVALADGTLLAVGERGAAFRSTDGGDAWEPLDFPYEGSMFGAVVVGGTRVVAFGLRGRVFVSDDAGDAWTAVESGTTLSLMGGSILADGRVALAGMNGLVLVSDDGGDTFTRYRHPDGDALGTVFEVPGFGPAVAGESGLAPLDLSAAAVAQ